jgi:hypothetical protein
MLRRGRRPLLRGAMIGGAGYMAGKAGQRRSQEEAEQNARLNELEAQQQYAPPPPPPPAPAAPAAQVDVVGRLKELAELKQSGVLSDQEFEAAKQKLLAS